MAVEKKISYPKIPRNNWFLLRDRFKQRTPERVSPSYVATALNMSEASASANIIPPLRAFGLIDDEGKPTDLAYDWRDDSKYAEVCKTIFENVYPQELRDIFHDPDKIDPVGISGWFARQTKSGEAAAKKSAAAYVMLFEADLSKAKELKTTKSNNGGEKTGAAKPLLAKKAASNPATKKAVEEKIPLSKQAPDENSGKFAFGPKLHIDIQIHISPDSSPEQIEKIFESMAKHLPFKG
jgi:hypothetical protein